MESYKTEAAIIRRRNFSEKDRILTLFSSDRGKVEVLAKGARRPGSKLSYHSDIGFIGKFQIARGKNLRIVTEIEPIFLPEGARGEFLKTEKLSYIFKIIDRLYHEDEPHRETYELLKAAIKKISVQNHQLVFLVFILKIIEDLGLKPELYDCITCRKTIKSKDKLTFSRKGGICHTDCQAGEPIRAEVIKLLRLIFDEPFPKITQSKVDEKVFAETYRTVELYFEWNFGKILPDRIM